MILLLNMFKNFSHCNWYIVNCRCYLKIYVQSLAQITNPVFSAFEFLLIFFTAFAHCILSLCHLYWRTGFTFKTYLHNNITIWPHSTSIHTFNMLAWKCAHIFTCTLYTQTYIRYQYNISMVVYISLFWFISVFVVQVYEELLIYNIKTKEKKYHTIQTSCKFVSDIITTNG